MKRTILTFLSLSVLIGCYNRDTDYYPTDKPDPANIIGTYRLSEESAKAVKDAGYSQIDGKIEILPDGKFSMSKIPDWWNKFGKSLGGYDSGQGKWELKKQQSWWCLFVDFESRRDFHSKPDESGFVTTMTISGKRPPYYLLLYVGDPDNGNVMVYERQTVDSGNADWTEKGQGDDHTTLKQ